MNKMNKIYCTECPYFTDVVYDGGQWFGARCKKDGHSTMPSMYAIKSLHNNCPLVAEVEPQEISDRNLKMWEEIYAEEKRRESEDNG